MSMPFYVAPEQMMKDKADYARKGISRGRSLAAVVCCRGHPHLRREPVQHPAQGVGDLRPHRLRRRRQVQRVRPAAHRRHPPRRPQGLLLQPGGRRRPQPGQRLRPDPGPDLHPRDQADGGGDPGGRAGRPAGRRPALPHPLRRHRGRRDRLPGPGRRRRDRGRPPGRRRFGRAATASCSPPRCRRRCSALAGPDRQLGAEALEVAVLERAAERRAFRRMSDDEVARPSPATERPEPTPEAI